ncbi:adenosylcobinamide-GDP ribazoletransferase [Calderihabitans maritimus]|uniref:Adenosylcobinamide-GDP ribazoletransferase n=1 Tax=Calderihabitans maritimus TaxID=1246530 RepID=A0A1Z5HPS7_9FIRM|nr:adenosylcobinamide-GDP ribazoletransferase [Calderihabitans maritimus]GAW91514.1 cobalamin 5'-phosphate synthase [Calderihabitans maritimus]
MIRFLIALQFLTRITLREIEPKVNDMARSLVYFPVVGAMIGFVLGVGHLWTGIFLPKEVVAAILLAIGLALTGGLHLDGVMDTFDGLLGGHSPERRLEIMKDSRVGAHGVTAALVIVFLKFALFQSLGRNQGIPFLVEMGMLSRWGAVLAIGFFPYAREAGLGMSFYQHATKREVLIGSSIALGLAYYLTGWVGLITWLITGVLVYIWSRKVVKLLGGHTGDTYGATIEMLEVVVLLFLLSLEAVKGGII